MTKFYLYFVILLALVLSNKARSPGRVDSHKWDYLVFTQEWPQVSCLSWQSLNPSHKCNITKDVNTWTVHGIWPSSTSGSDPSFCNSSRPFNMSQVQSIRPSLTKYWPNVYANTPEDDLWSHEWEKHGTCAASLPELKDELAFFDRGVSWIQKYNMLNILKEAGIEPNDETPVLAYDVEYAVKKALGVKPLLVCDYQSKKKTWHLFEIEICFNKQLKMINCPKGMSLSPKVLGNEDCPLKELVWYPVIRHTDTTKEATERGDQIPFIEKLLKNVLSLIFLL